MRRKLFQTLVLTLTLITTLAVVPNVVSQPLQGPNLDHKRWVVTKGPDARLIRMLTGDADVWKGLSRTSDIETLSADGFTVTATPGFHISYITFNMRRWYFGPQEGGNPGQALRHAIAHLIDKNAILPPLFGYIASPLDTVVPPAMRGWHNPNVDPHPYNASTPSMLGEGIQVLYMPPTISVTPFAGGSDPGRVYRYLGGNSWEQVSPDLGKAVLSLVEFDGQLYAGVVSYGGVGQVYRYDGTNWILVGDGMDEQVSSLVVWNVTGTEQLYAGTVDGSKLLRYNATTNNWTEVLSGVLPNGIRSMYVWEKDNALYLGDFDSDTIVRYNGTTYQIVLQLGRSCIWDFQSYGGYLYASAWQGYLYRSQDGFSWTEVYKNPERRNIWALEVFQGYLYFGMDWIGNGSRVAQLWRYDGIGSPQQVWNTTVTHRAEGILSMATDGSTLFIGLGGEEGYYGSMGVGKVYSYDGITFQLISPLGPPITAAEILLEAGWWWDGVNWIAPDGTPLPTIEFLSPLFDVDPQKAEIAAMIAAEMQAVKLPDGTPAPLPVISMGQDLGYLHDLVFNLHDYDMAILNLDTGKHPEYLYDYFHSSQDIPGGYNIAGLNNSTLDAKLETIMSSLDYGERKNARHNVQLELMGDPAYTYRNVTDGLLPWVPIYSEVIFDAFNPNLLGMVMSPGFGAADNWWTEQNTYWTPGLERIEDGKTVAIWILDDKPWSFNPLVSANPYGWQIMREIFDPLIMWGPFTYWYMPWIATDYVIFVTPSGMEVTYWLRDDIYWQDGYQYTAFDAQFSLLFLRDNMIPRYKSAWEHIVDVVVHDPYSFTVVSDVTSLFLLDQWARLAAMLPPQVWDRAWLNQQAILDYHPTEPYNVAPGYTPGPTPPPTNLFGTGPWVFDFYDPIGMFAELHANRNYFLTTAEVGYLLTEMFHEIGDVDRDGDVDTLDLYRVVLAYGSVIGDPYYDPDADLNIDGIVDSVDYFIVTYYYGSTFMGVPLPPPSFDVAISTVTPSKTIVGTGYDMSIEVTVENRGDDPATVDVSVYYDGNLIGTYYQINLGLGRRILTFTWNTTSVPKGNYTISASVPVHPLEINASDNTLWDDTVLVTIPGDVNGDRTVDIFDIGTISAHWYKGPPIGPLGYHPNADINNDGSVDIFDIGITSAHWNQSW